MDKILDLKKKLKHAVIIILGAPGSGKGTQSSLLADKLSFYHIETSKLLEDAFQEAAPGESVRVDGKKYLIADEKKLWETGDLCSPDFVYHLIQKKVKELHEEGENLILSASPRTLQEAKKLVPLIKSLYGPKSIKVMLLQIKPEETRFRNSHRRICELMRHPILYSNDSLKLEYCPLDGSKLLRRKGLDDLDSIKIRLQEYKNKTLPLVDYFEKENLSMHKLNGSLAPSKVFMNILKDLSE